MSSEPLFLRSAINWQETQLKVNRVYVSLLSIHYTDTPQDFHPIPSVWGSAERKPF
jgi:hypothetical protein